MRTLTLYPHSEHYLTKINLIHMLE